MHVGREQTDGGTELSLPLALAQSEVKAKLGRNSQWTALTERIATAVDPCAEWLQRWRTWSVEVEVG